MSHDISLTCTHCGSLLLELNMTSNLNPMWREAGIYLGDPRWEGKSGAEMLPTVQRAIERMTEDPDNFRRFNPDNGWGNYEGALETLVRLRDAICRDPTAVYHDCH